MRRQRRNMPPWLVHFRVQLRRVRAGWTMQHRILRRGMFHEPLLRRCHVCDRVLHQGAVRNTVRGRGHLHDSRLPGWQLLDRLRDRRDMHHRKMPRERAYPLQRTRRLRSPRRYELVSDSRHSVRSTASGSTRAQGASHEGGSATAREGESCGTLAMHQTGHVAPASGAVVGRSELRFVRSLEAIGFAPKQ